MRQQPFSMQSPGIGKVYPGCFDPPFGNILIPMIFFIENPVVSKEFSI
jgi:hypothetical protein